MNPCFFLCTLCMLFKSSSAVAEPSTSPSVHLPPGVIAELSQGMDVSNPAVFQKLDCYSLLNKSVTYQSAHATALCNEAEISCLRYGLLQQFLLGRQNTASTKAKEKKKAPSHNYQTVLATSLEDVRLKLVGCAIAIEAVERNAGPLLNQSGFAEPAAQ